MPTIAKIFAMCREKLHPFPPAAPQLNVTHPTGTVAGYDALLADLKRVSPLPIQFRDDISVDGGAVYNAIIVNGDMSQRQTTRTVINQIARVLLGTNCQDDEQLEIAADSVTFIVSRALGLDAIAVGLRHIEKYSQDRERKVKEKFLDAIQKTALYFIDTLEGIREARRIGYSYADFFLFTNKKTAFRLFRQGYDLYMIYPKDGELLVMNKKQLEKYDGPFAVYRGDWFGVAGRMAA